MGLSGAVLVAGTTSDAGKSAVVAGICRWLVRRGVSVAPFKAQNMSNNSVVTPDGGEIGRAQAMQAHACGIAPCVDLNPVLLKPEGDRTSQVVVRGRADGRVSALSYRTRTAALADVVADSLADLRSRYDVVVCEGAGSPAEINLRATDLANMGLAQRADLPVLVVGDIDRGGVLAHLYGTLAVLDAADQARIAGFVINKFRGDQRLLNPGLDQLRALTGRPTYGVLPWTDGLWLDAEDSLSAVADAVLGRPGPPRGEQWLRVAVVRFPRISNATDAEALACEPGVAVRYVTEPSRLLDADVVVLPGSKSTVSDLAWLRSQGLADAITAHAGAGGPVLGICGGYQMLGRRIRDPHGVEAAPGTEVDGLGLLDLEVSFDVDKHLGTPTGTAWGQPVTGYEIHHGRVAVAPSTPLLEDPGEGADAGPVLGSHWHGLAENDAFRRVLLTRLAALAGRDGFAVAQNTSFVAERARQLDLLGDLVEHHLDTSSLEHVIRHGAPRDLPVLAAGMAGSPGRCPVVAAPRFPFSAVVGHDDLRLALLLNAVHPGVGGVLVRGEKGTAKSTAVRALAALLPDLHVVTDCRFGCDPADPDPACPDGPHTGAHGATVRPARLVELPVGATEDRLIGSLDLEKALSHGERAYQPGLLADAHRGVLYVDEVNLLHDHLVDLLLDAAAMGRAHVERDGVSVSHAARFLLVGTMNPEEGELRPQLLDRFGLTVEVRASREVGTRVEVMRRRIAFEDDPAGFAARWADAESDTARRLVAARERVSSVRVDDRELRRIASVCASFDVDGMRADLVITRAAAAHAAWRGADAVTSDDVRVAARLALPHRRRRDPFDEPGIDDSDLDDALREAQRQLDEEPEPDPPGGGGPDDGGPEPDPGEPDPGGSDPGASDADDDGTDRTSPGRPPEARGPDGDAPNGPLETPGAPNGPLETPAEPDPSPDERGDRSPAGGDGAGRAVTLGAAARLRPAVARRFEVPGLGAGAPGRRSRARTETGRVVRASDGATTRAADLHVPATVLSAAPHQHARGRTGPGLLLHRDDLRRAEREGREGNLVLFVVDASGSMAARKRMTAVSGAVLGLLRDAYQRRDKVGLVTFRAGTAELALPPTSSVPTAQTRLARLRTGGRTPLAGGLLKARAVLAAERLRDPRRRPLLVLLTDGRATVAARPGGDPVADARRAAALLGADGTHTVVVDCESGPVRLGLAAPLAAAAGGTVVALDELSADGVGDVVRAARTIAGSGRAA